MNLLRELLETWTPPTGPLIEYAVGKVIEFSCNGKGRGGNARVTAMITKINPKTVNATECNRSAKPGTSWTVSKSEIKSARDPKPDEEFKR